MTQNGKDCQLFFWKYLFDFLIKCPVLIRPLHSYERLVNQSVNRCLFNMNVFVCHFFKIKNKKIERKTVFHLEE